MKQTNLEEQAFDLILKAAADKLADDIAAEDIPCTLTEDEIKIREEQRKAVWKKLQKTISQSNTQNRRRFRGKKLFVLIAILAVSLSLLIANVSAFRTFLFKTYTELKGTTLNVRTTDRAPMSGDSIKNFLMKDEIIVPGWLPPDVSLEKIDDLPPYVKLHYKSDNMHIILHESILQTDVTDAFETKGNEVKVKDTKIMGMDGVIIYAKNETGVEIYEAIWNSDEMRYNLTTDSSLILLETILKNMEFLK